MQIRYDQLYKKRYAYLVKLVKISHVIFFVAGSFLILFGFLNARMYFKTYSAFKNGQTINAVIASKNKVNFHLDSTILWSLSGDCSRVLGVRLKDTIIRQLFFFGSEKKYEIGDSIKIAYFTDEVTIAYSKDDLGIYFGMAIFSISLAVIGYSILYYLFFRKARETYIKRLLKNASQEVFARITRKEITFGLSAVYYKFEFENKKFRSGDCVTFQEYDKIFPNRNYAILINPQSPKENFISPNFSEISQ